MSRRLVLIAFAAGGIAIPLVYSLSGTCAEPGPHNAPTGISVADPDPVPGKETPSTATAYLDLVKQKVALLSAEELGRETETLRKELAELQAIQKLRKAEQDLEQLIDQFPGSRAAGRARLMLDAGREQIVPARNLNDGVYQESVRTLKQSIDYVPESEGSDLSCPTIRPAAPDPANKRR